MNLTARQLLDGLKEFEEEDLDCEILVSFPVNEEKTFSSVPHTIRLIDLKRGSDPEARKFLQILMGESLTQALETYRKGLE